MNRRNSTLAAAALPLLENLEERRMLSSGAFSFGLGFGHAGVVDTGNSVVTDAAGNVYVLGTYHDVMNVNPQGTPRRNLRAQSDTSDVLLAKYNSRGKLQWARSFGGPGDEEAKVVQLGPDGDIYITGTFEGQANFAGVNGTLHANSHGDKDVFVARLNSSGLTKWVGSVGGGMKDYVDAMSIGPDGDVYLAGTIRLGGDLDPGPGTFSPTVRGTDDTYVSRINGATGDLKWARVYGEDNSMESVRGLAVDPQGGVYVAGAFSATVEFQRGTGAFNLSAAGRDIYLGHITGGGAWDSIRRIGGEDDDNVSGIALGPQGDLYVTGNFESDINFGNGFSFTSRSDNDGFIARFTPQGNASWVVPLGGEDLSLIARAISVDAAGNVYTTGDFNGTFSIGSGRSRKILQTHKEDDSPIIPEALGSGPFGLTNNVGTDIYILKLDASGRLKYARRIGSAHGSISARAVTADAAGNLITTGGFAGKVDLRPMNGHAYRSITSEEGTNAVFVVKLTK